MANHAVLVLNKVAAFDVGSYNRSAVAAADIDNGNIFRLNTQTSASSGNTDDWWVTAPSASASQMNMLWMAASPEVVVTQSGTLYYKGLNQDPRLFTNLAGYTFDAVRLVKGDVFTLTSDGLSAASPTALIQATDGLYTWSLVSSASWSAFSTSAGSFVSAYTSASYIGTTYISLGSGGIDSQRIVAYKFVVVTD